MSKVKIDEHKIGKFLKALRPEEFIYLKHSVVMRDNLQQMINKYKLSKEDFCKRFEMPANKYTDFTLGNYSYSLRDIAKMECAWHQLEKEREIEHVFKVADRPIFKDATEATVTEVKKGSLIKFEVTVKSFNEFDTDALLFHKPMLDAVNFGNHFGISVKANWLQINKAQMPVFTNAYGAVVDFICSLKKNWKISFTGVDGYTLHHKEKELSQKLNVTAAEIHHGPDFFRIDAFTHIQIRIPKKGFCKFIFEEVKSYPLPVSPPTIQFAKRGDVVIAIKPKPRTLTDGSAYVIISSDRTSFTVTNDNGQAKTYSKTNFRMPE